MGMECYSKFTGTQILSIDINVKWDLTQSAIIFFKPQFRIGNPQLSIDITEPPAHPVTPEPFITLGQIKLSDLITVVIGAVLSAGGLGTIFIIWLVKQSKIKIRLFPPPKYIQTTFAEMK